MKYDINNTHGIKKNIEELIFHIKTLLRGISDPTCLFPVPNQSKRKSFYIVLFIGEELGHW